MRYVLLITDIPYLYGRSFLVNEYSLIKKKKKKLFETYKSLNFSHKYISQNTSWQKVRPSRKNTHLLHCLEGENRPRASAREEHLLRLIVKLSVKGSKCSK